MAVWESRETPEKVGVFKYVGNLDTRGTAVAPANKKGFTTQLVPNGFLGQQGLPFLPKQQF